jgi:hypothetical protein
VACGGFGHASVTSPIGSDILEDISTFSVEGGVGKLRIYPTKVAHVGTFSVSAKQSPAKTCPYSPTSLDVCGIEATTPITLTVDPDCPNREWEIDLGSLPSEDIEVGKSFNFTISDNLERDADNVTWSKVCPEWCNTDIAEQ